MHWTLRAYRPADEAAVIALWQRCGLTRPWNDPARDIQRKLQLQADGFGVALAQDGELIGSVMAGYEGHRGWINYLAVAPQVQRAGLGRGLMAWAEAWLRAQGCPKINLQLRRDNLAAIGFYQAIGFGEDAVLSFGKRLVHDD
jgi:ribosomal protein S18 acetylase RimI-like enzyme